MRQLVSVLLPTQSIAILLMLPLGRLMGRKLLQRAVMRQFRYGMRRVVLRVWYIRHRSLSGQWLGRLMGSLLPQQDMTIAHRYGMRAPGSLLLLIWDRQMAFGRWPGHMIVSVSLLVMQMALL